MRPPLRLIVTGMHRSGTSFVASLLAAWNVRMGDRLLPADRGNPAVYFEDVDFLELNRRILLACTPPEDGHRDWGWTESENFDAGQLPAHRNAAAALVAARERTGGPWGWKDPRTSMLLDFWDDVLGPDARFLLLYRHSWEVADSMLRTGADVWLTHPGYPARIWTRYNRRILDFHRRHRDRTLLVSTNRLLRDPEAFVAMVRRHFGIEADADTMARLRVESSFVSLPDDDPLPRLWRYTNAESMDLLGALDDAAHLGNGRRWEVASSTRARRPAAQPRLSVIIPCHDDGDYLIDAVASVERNAPADTEVIVVDDGSTQPRTRQVLDALREAGHRVIEQPHSGLSAARNRGIAASAGDYLLPLDADNRLLPGFAAEAVALLDTEPAAAVVYGDRREFGARTGDVAVPELDLPRLLWSNYIDACAVVRRAVWSDVGGYDIAFRDWEDWDFWLGAAERGWRFVHLPRPTFEYRIRPDSLHQKFLRRDDFPSTLRRLYDKHRASVSEHASEILVAAHVERRQLFADTAALRASRDSIQTEIDRLALGSKEHSDALQKIVAARDEELASIKPILAARDEELTPGVNVYGYAFAESGTGQIVRSVVAALAAEGIPYAVVPFTRTISRQQRVFQDLGTAAPSFDTNLICVNADQVPLFFESMRGQLLPAARNIGLWAWEVEDLPSAMVGSERHLDEVWGISSFTAAALARCLTKPVRAFPLPVVVPEVRRRTRAELGMPDGFLFLFCFDYDSVFRRKNPLAVVAAFRQAFPDRAGVALYIKTTNAERHAAEGQELRAAVEGRANIVIRDAYVTSDDYFSMLDACDCYVSLHRSEGFGLTVAEAMALGKPVISTAYSSTLEFANESNSFPVPARMVEVGDDAPPYPPQSRWADPDVAAAAEQMARVYADRSGAAAVGARARADIETLHGPSARGPLLRRLLDQNRRARDAFAAHDHTERTAFARSEEVTMEPIQPSSVEPPGLFEAEAMAVESLLGSPRPNLPSRMQRLTTPLRRLVLRCIRVYWVQQLAIDRALLAAMRTLRRESRGETASHAAMLQRQGSAQERIGAETARMREELTELAAGVRAVHERIGAIAALTPPQTRAKARPDDDPHREDGQAAEP